MANLDPNASPEQIMAVYQQILPRVLLVVLYAFLLLGMFIAGLVLLIILHRRVIWKEADTPLPKRTVFKTVYLNAGMVLYVLLCIASFFLALL